MENSNKTIMLEDMQCRQWMKMAYRIGKESKDPRTQVGAVLVDAKNRIISSGYNKFPNLCEEKFDWYGERDSPDDKNMYVVHAETKAILSAPTYQLNDASLFVTCHPCDGCAKLILHVGIRNIYFIDARPNRGWARKGKKIFERAGVITKEILLSDILPNDDS